MVAEDQCFSLRWCILFDRNGLSHGGCVIGILTRLVVDADFVIAGGGQNRWELVGHPGGQFCVVGGTAMNSTGGVFTREKTR